MMIHENLIKSQRNKARIVLPFENGAAKIVATQTSNWDEGVFRDEH